MNQLTRIDLHGFKTIRALDDFHVDALNVLIGANGSGKSNFISFFRLLSWMIGGTGNLQFFVGKSGGASSLLHEGANVTPQIQARLEFETETGINEYTFRLFHAGGDTLIFAEEKFRYSLHDSPSRAPWKDLGAGHREAELLKAADNGDRTARWIRQLLQQCVVYQFHNTSETARIRQRWDTEDNRFLKEDGANLAPFLLRLSSSEPKAYQRIVSTLRQIVPFFADFVLEPVNGSVLLQWRERHSDLVFGAHQASDGTLRTMALIALLLQPVEDVPAVVILDEPELGLHPFAINVIVGLLKGLAVHRQIILATQSMTLIDYCDPQDVIVVDRTDRASAFRRLDSESLQDWLADYSLAELWEKNVLGGRPS